MVGLDLGERRIGVAVSDSERTLATPVEVIERSGSADRDRLRLKEVVEEWEADTIVVGLPVSLDGGDGPAAVAARDEADALAKVVGVPVDLQDERFTTVEAQRYLTRQGQRGPRARKKIDMVAATLILQAWLDSK